MSPASKIIALGCLVGAVTCASSPRVAHAQALQRVREKVREAPSTGSASSPPQRSRSTRYVQRPQTVQDENPLGTFFASLLLFMPFGAVNCVLESERNYDHAYLDFPYAQRFSGNIYRWPALESGASFCPMYDKRRAGIVRDHFELSPKGVGLDVQTWAVQLAVDGAYLQQGPWRTGLRLRLSMPLRLEFNTAWSYYYEALAEGRHDELALGKAHLAVRFAQNEYLQFRTGLGYRHLIDGKGQNFGVNWQYGFELFPIRPLVVRGTVELGNLGRAFVFEASAEIGVLIHALEIFAGFDVLLIGGAPLTGPHLGLQYWF